MKEKVAGTTEVVEIKSVTATLRGIRPMLLHNGIMVDRKDPYTVRIAEINRTRGKNLSDALYEERERLEWLGGLYMKDRGIMKPEGDAELYMPADNIEKNLVEGAAKSKKAKLMQAAVFCAEPNSLLEWDGPHTLDKMYFDPQRRFMFRKPVKIGQSRIMKIRPMLPTGWKLTVTFLYDPHLINVGDIQTALMIAGSLIGLGDWRPKFGRFLVENFHG